MARRIPNKKYSDKGSLFSLVPGDILQYNILPEIDPEDEDEFELYMDRYAKRYTRNSLSWKKLVERKYNEGKKLGSDDPNMGYKIIN